LIHATFRQADRFFKSYLSVIRIETNYDTSFEIIQVFSFQEISIAEVPLSKLLIFQLNRIG